jgi:hypothetical protein
LANFQEDNRHFGKKRIKRGENGEKMAMSAAALAEKIEKTQKNFGKMLDKLIFCCYNIKLHYSCFYHKGISALF